MSLRYVSNLAVMVGGGFLVVATQAFTPATAATLVFAVAIALTAVSLFLVISQTSIAQRVVGGLGVVLGAWTIVASLVFTATTTATLGFASALAFVGLGVIGLTAHELSAERTVETLAVETEAAAAVDGLMTDRHRVAA